MFKKFSILSLVAAILFLGSCADKEKSPILTFDKVGKGAYPRLLTETTRNLNLYDFANVDYQYTVEFVDLEKGALVAEYQLVVTYEDKNPDIGGDKSDGPKDLRSFSSGEFTTSEKGFKSISVTIKGSELLSLFSLTQADIGPGDRFVVNGAVILTDGSTFKGSNSSAAVRGAAFAGHFDYVLSAVCPSDLGGTYTYTCTGQSTDGCCPDEVTTTGELTLTDEGSGNYTISDWSAGLYFAWYNVYGITQEYVDGGGLAITITDVCGDISADFDEPFGETGSLSGHVDSATGVITYTWDNAYGDTGSVVMTPK